MILVSVGKRPIDPIPDAGGRLPLGDPPCRNSSSGRYAVLSVRSECRVGEPRRPSDRTVAMGRTAAKIRWLDESEAVLRYPRVGGHDGYVCTCTSACPAACDGGRCRCPAVLGEGHLDRQPNDQCSRRDDHDQAGLSRRLSREALHPARGWLLRMGEARRRQEATGARYHEERRAVRPGGTMVALAAARWRRSCRVVHERHDRAQRAVQHVHDRRPVILAPGDYERWLNVRSDEDPADLIRPYASEAMIAYPVSRPENDDPTLIDPLDAGTSSH